MKNLNLFLFLALMAGLSTTATKISAAAMGDENKMLTKRLFDLVNDPNYSIEMPPAFKSAHEEKVTEVLRDIVEKNRSGKIDTDADTLEWYAEIAPHWSADLGLVNNFRQFVGKPQLTEKELADLRGH